MQQRVRRCLFSSLAEAGRILLQRAGRARRAGDDLVGNGGQACASKLPVEYPDDVRAGGCVNGRTAAGAAASRRDDDDQQDNNQHRGSGPYPHGQAQLPGPQPAPPPGGRLTLGTGAIGGRRCGRGARRDRRGNRRCGLPGVIADRHTPGSRYRCRLPAGWRGLRGRGRRGGSSLRRSYRLRRSDGSLGRGGKASARKRRGSGNGHGSSQRRSTPEIGMRKGRVRPFGSIPPANLGGVMGVGVPIWRRKITHGKKAYKLWRPDRYRILRKSAGNRHWDNGQLTDYGVLVDELEIGAFKARGCAPLWSRTSLSSRRCPQAACGTTSCPSRRT